jgi:NADPH:quinone reductase-like Zn-dependent oxidoreductase
MRAVVLSGHGGLDKLEYHQDWPTPKPASGEVLVRVGACGLNNTDINTSQSDAELATYPCAYTTAENLVSKSGLRPGETVVIAGASGGVGSAAIQLCRLRAAKVIAIASPAKAELLVQLGANQVIERGTDDLEAAIANAVGGKVDVALDVVGGNMFMPLINSLRKYCSGNMKITRIQACRQAPGCEPGSYTRRHQHKAANCAPPISQNLESKLNYIRISHPSAVTA